MVKTPDKGPFDRQRQYEKNAEQIINEAALPVIKELGREAIIEAEQIVQTEGVLREATEPLVEAMAQQTVAGLNLFDETRTQ